MKGKGGYGLIIVLFMFLLVSLTSCSGGGSKNNNNSSSQLPTYVKKFLYVANHDSGDVYGYSIADDGALWAVEGTYISTAGGFPESITADPLERFVYVANWSENGGTINVYSVDATSGALTEVVSSPKTIPTATTLESVTVYPSGGFLYVADSKSGNVYSYSVAIDGTLSSTGDPIAAGGYPETIVADPQGRFVYVANWSTYNISAYTISTDGVLTEVPGSPFNAGFNPYSVTVDPSGSFVYVANYGDGNPDTGSVYAYLIKSTGALQLIDSYPAGLGPNSVTVDPSGRFAYVANHDSDNISAYSIGSGGSLIPVAGSPFLSGMNPYSVTVDPSGSFVYVANYGDGIAPSNVSAYIIESGGALTPIGSYIAGTGPVSLTTVGILQ